MAATVFLYGIDILFHPLPSGTSTLFQKFAASAVFFGAAVLCAMRGRISRGERSAWWLFGFAMVLWGTASVYYSLVLWDVEDPPAPSLADAFWLAFYVPAYAGLFRLVRSRAGSFRKAAWLDALVGGLGVGGAGAALVFQGVLANTDGTPLAVATNLAYPVGDLGLLAMVVAALTMTGWRATGVWHWVAPALALFAATDSIYLVGVADGSYVLGGVVDLGWPMAALLLGIAAWRREVSLAPAVRPRAAAIVPGISGLAALALLLLDHFVRLNPLALGLATASIVVILIRLYMTVQDNRRMLTKSRREAATDALTGLGNRRQLTTDLGVHLAELDDNNPLMLTLFDLDGFKHYNDTFGHLAGDQLLERLGRRLTDLLAGRGTAYRMGGDEFCGLWVLPTNGEGSLTAGQAAAALSEHGDAFSIGCSFGSVLLPTEATDPAEALRTADRRMYSRKAAGRVSAGRQSSDVLLRTLTERDSALGGHLSSVAELAPRVAMRLGVSADQAETTRQTALLHDVGKLAIPDAILRKKGPLDESEWTFMKRHTIIGERIVSAAPALADVARFVRSTHERYDGGGYPDALAGESIPLTARIVSVCDAYDAMLTDRVYRKARGSSAAIAELRHCSGTQFDPKVVDALIGVLDDAGDHVDGEVQSASPFSPTYLTVSPN
jgi:diguanylate cyclase (GGDEF)-like protein